MERIQATPGEDTLEFEVDGRTVRVLSRPADDDQLGRLFEFEPSPAWSDASPLTDEDVAGVVRDLIDTAAKEGRPLEVVGVTPGAAEAFPDDPRISVMPVDPVAFSLPGAPTGLVLQMDERGDGHLWALGEQRILLGSDGMWWIVTRLIEALEDPKTVSEWPRFLVVGGFLGGPATQVSLHCGDGGVGLVWSRLESGVVGDVLAVQELSPERVAGWLNLLRPVRDGLERRRVHRQRMRPAKTAEKWARVLDRWNT